VFLSVFVVQLLIYGLHELTEANLFAGSEALHWATEPYGPDGRYGQFLSYMLLALPVGWLLIAALFGSRKPAGGAASAVGQPAAR
jgi:high-affinity iron transporter